MEDARSECAAVERMALQLHSSSETRLTVPRELLTQEEGWVNLGKAEEDFDPEWWPRPTG